MRCIIPVHQEYYPGNSLERSRLVCQELTILYIFDANLLEKIRSETSYTLPSNAIEDMENYIVEIQKREAEKLSRKYDANLKFVLSDYMGAIEDEVIRGSYDLLMTDHMRRRFLHLSLPVWIDRGEPVDRIGFYVGDATKIKTLVRQIDFLRKIAEVCDAEMCIIPKSSDILNILSEKECGRLGGTVAVQRPYFSQWKKWSGNLILI